MEGGEPVADIDVTSAADVSYTAEGKKLDVKAEEIKQKASTDMQLASDADLKLQDAEWSTSLKEINPRKSR